MTIKELQRDITDYKRMRPHIRATLRPADWEAHVYIRADGHGLPGMIIEPKIFLGKIEGGQTSAVINGQMLKAWNISKTQLISDAIENLEPVITPMGGVLQEMAQFMPEEDFEDIANPLIPMYVITNKERWYGAAVILKAKKQLREMFPKGYIIIPSSIHEMIIVPGSKADIETYNGMVREVNSSALEPWEILGQRAYLGG